jgi:membrane-associated protein
VTKTYYTKYGGHFTLILARFIPIIRTFAPILAGVIKVDWKSFMLFNVIGATAWIVSLSGIGYLLVQVFPGIMNYMSYIFITLIVITAIPVLRVVFKSYKGV